MIRNLTLKFALGAAFAASAASGALFSGTLGLAQGKMTAPLPTGTPAGIGAGSTELELSGLSRKLEKLEKANQDLQRQINSLKQHVEYVNPVPDGINIEANSIQMQLNTLEKKVNNHTHRINYSFINLPSLGCAKCVSEPAVVTYNELNEMTSAPIFK